jgi:hypothetical protein
MAVQRTADPVERQAVSRSTAPGARSPEPGARSYTTTATRSRGPSVNPCRPLGAVGGGRPYAAASVKMTHMARDVLRRGIRGFSLSTATLCRGAPG